MQWQWHCIQNKIQGNCWRLTVLILCVENTMEHCNGSKTDRDWKRCWASQLINCVTNKGNIEIQRRCTDQLGGKTSEGGNEGKPVLIRPTMPVFNGAGFRCTRVLSHLPQCSTMYNNGGALRLGGSHIFPPPQIDRPVRFVWQYLEISYCNAMQFDQLYRGRPPEFYNAIYGPCLSHRVSFISHNPTYVEVEI